MAAVFRHCYDLAARVQDGFDFQVIVNEGYDRSQSQRFLRNDDNVRIGLCAWREITIVTFDGVFDDDRIVRQGCFEGFVIRESHVEVGLRAIEWNQFFIGK